VNGKGPGTSKDAKEDVMRGFSGRTAVAAIALLSLVSAASAANTRTQRPAERPAKPHHLLIQVNQNDPAVMNLALNNATNVLEYYRNRGEEVSVDVVAYGPGLQMLRADTSPVKDRIKTLKETAFPGKVQFSACNVTKEGMEKKEGHPITVVSEAAMVPSGVVHLMELQEKGWSYVRP
jgi:intracellular sulfur oxidation DsrE/DsrF family protein